MKINETTYWVTLASMPMMWTRRKNQLFVDCFKHSPQYTVIDLFERREVREELGVTPEEETLFEAAHEQLANNAFMVEDLLSQGYGIIPLISPDYPMSLKRNLKTAAPCVLYVKGNMALLNMDSIAIVGSRNADSVSLEFTANIARIATSEQKCVVSGFAKGVDRQALDAAIEAGGRSVIVLPQGITTFASGFRQYYQQICGGMVAVVSTFHPKAPWSKEFAMARNAVIYGLADEIYVAQSDSKGGTWAGVTAGLRRGQRICVRVPGDGEKNANLQLIGKGGIGVDLVGNIVEMPVSDIDARADGEEDNKSANADASVQELKKRVLDLLGKKRPSKDVRELLQLDWSDARMKKFLRSLPEVDEEKKSGRILFFRKGVQEQTLFSDI